MVKLVRKLKAGSSNSASPAKPPKELTIEEARETYDVGTIERLLAEIKYYRELDEQSRENSNAKNRAKTQVAKNFKALIADGKLARGDNVIIHDQAFSWDFARSVDINAEEFLALYEKKQISKEIFLQCISVTKGITEKLLGGPMLADLLVDNIGKTPDVRKLDLDKPIDAPFKIVPHKPAPPKIKKTQTMPVGTTANRAGRRIRTNRG